MGIFPILWPPKIFFQKSGSVTFVPLWCSNFMQIIRKNQWTVSEIFKDRRTTDGRTDRPRTRAITKDPLGWTRGPKCKWIILCLIKLTKCSILADGSKLLEGPNAIKFSNFKSFHPKIYMKCFPSYILFNNGQQKNEKSIPYLPPQNPTRVCWVYEVFQI